MLGAAGIAVIAVWTFMLFGSALQSFLASIPVLSTVFSFFFKETTTFTPVGLFLVIFLDTIFFVIFPGELYFFWALNGGMNPAVALIAVSIGGVLGHIANYWMGRYARRKGKDRPRGAKLIRFAERANGKWGTAFLALAMATPSPEVIGFAYGLGNFPARRYTQVVAIFRPIKWMILLLAFYYLRPYLGVFGISPA